jgi:hypothetical protein
MLKTAMATVVLLSLLLQEIDNPTYKHWSKFKPGSSVTLKATNDTNGMKSGAVIVYTLKSCDAKEAVVTMTGSTTVGDTKTDMPASDGKHAAKVKKVEPAKDAPKPEEGDEEIEVAGKKLKCHWVKSVSENNGMKTTSKVWTSDAVPGGMARSESLTEGKMKMSSTMEVTAFEKK